MRTYEKEKAVKSAEFDSIINWRMRTYEKEKAVKSAEFAIINWRMRTYEKEGGKKRTSQTNKLNHL